jgi:hypothetical protein
VVFCYRARVYALAGRDNSTCGDGVYPGDPRSSAGAGRVLDGGSSSSSNSSINRAVILLVAIEAVVIVIVVVLIRQ